MSRVIRIAFGLFAVALIAAPAAAAPHGQAGTTPQRTAEQQAAEQQAPSRDIVVQALRREHRNIDEMIAPLPSVVAFKKVSEYSQFFAHCVKHPRLDRLHAIIDGEPNTPSYKLALDKIVRAHAGCYPQLPWPMPNPPFFGDCNPRIIDHDWGRTTCMAIYDRGALLQAAIDRYAPGFSLTAAEVNDPAVQARLDAREVPRNRHRLDTDRFYFEVAICMVRLEPGLATELVRSYGDAHFQSQIGQLILLRAKKCVGNADHVKVEPRQFAIYITDAAYRWEVAARGVDSLLPAVG
jgi:hypothetical protein